MPLVTPAPAHSPGPWTKNFDEDSQRTEVYAESQDLIVACIYDPGDEWLDEHTEWDDDKMQEVREAVEANACLIAAAPDLLALAGSFACACDERLSILREERAVSFSGFDDIDDQIGHWTALRNKCDSVLIKALPDSPEGDDL